jgi:Protein of unknown function (DUF2793)
MTDTYTQNLDILQMVVNPTNAHVQFNAAVNRIDAVTNLVILDSAPPVAPPEFAAEGACYVVPASATGAWATFTAGYLAIYNSGWSQLQPWHGLAGHDARQNRTIWYHGGKGSWIGQMTAEADIGTLPAPLDFGDVQTNETTLSAKIDALLVKLREEGLLAPDTTITKVSNQTMTVAEGTVDILA